MKTTILTLFAIVLSASGAYATASPQHGQDGQESSASHGGPVTISIRQTDESMCEVPMWVGFYNVTLSAFAHGAAQVEVSEFEKVVFAWIRSSEEIFGDGAEGWVEHIKDIPGQLVTIIREDPAVLDSCANFMVALVGPP